MKERAAADAGGPGSTAKSAKLRGRRWHWLGGLLLVLIGAIVGINRLLQPERMGALAVAQAEQTLGLRIVTDEPATLAVWPGLRLRLNGLHLLDPIDGAQIGSAQRVDLALPLRVLWSQQSELGQIELLEPVLMVPALSAWLQRGADDGPPSPLQLPPFASAISVEGGRVIGENWEVRELSLELSPVRDGEQANLAAAAEIVAQDSSDQRFSLELQATPQQLADGIALQLAQLALQLEPGEADSMPLTLTAEGVIELQPQRWVIDLQIEPAGSATLLSEALPQSAIDALTPNIEQPLRLTYSGTPDFYGRATLESLDPARPLRASAELAELIRWMSSSDPGPSNDRPSETAASPLPPIELSLAVPSLAVSGLKVEGLKIEMISDSTPPDPTDTTPEKSTEAPTRLPQP